MAAPHVDTLRKFQRHHLLRQFGENGHVLPENLEVSTALDTVLDEVKKGDFRWLIEAPGTRYLAIQRLRMSDTFEWTSDHDKALAFRSKEQAEALMMAVRQMDRMLHGDNGLFAFENTIGNAAPVEHGWM